MNPFILIVSSLSFAAIAQDNAAVKSVSDDVALAWVPTGYPDAYALRPLTIPPGMFQLTLPIVLNLSKMRY